MFLLLGVCVCNSITLVRPLAPPSNQVASAHINNSHPRSIVTPRSTKATTLAEQREPLLQGLRASDVTRLKC